MTRRANVTKVQIAKRDLGMDDGTYRAMLERLTGRTSSTACSDQQLGVVLDELKAKGWKPKVVQGGKIRGRSGKVVIDELAKAEPRAGRAVASNPVAKKARALWISLHQLGEVRDPSESALEAFARRQLKVDRLQWANQSQGFRLIEALKAMAERAGWSQADGDVRQLKERLFEAQELRLSKIDPERMSEIDQARWVSDAELDDRIRENAGHLRAYQGGAG